MWRPRAVKEGHLRPGSRNTLPDRTSSGSLLTSRSQLQRTSVLKLSQDLGCVHSDAVSQIPRATHSTMRQLSCRREELSRWQTQTRESIGRVDQEITALEQVKDAAECCLQEMILYCQVLEECVLLRDGCTTGDLVHDHVLIGLEKEVQLTQEITELVQKQIYMLLEKLSSLRGIRTQLLADYRDKGEAIKLNTKCMTYDLKSPIMPNQYQPNLNTKGTLSYDQWLSRCKGLKLAVEKLVKECSCFRGNLQYTLAKLKNALESQRCTTDSILRKRINEMMRAKEVLEWEKQQIQDTIVDLVRDMQKLEAQLMGCGSKMQLAHSRLDILKQRPSLELCLDKPHISLMLEINNLAKIASGLRTNLQLSQQSLDPMYRDLFILENRLADRARALNVDQKCQNLRQRFLPLCGAAVVIANKPKLRLAPGPCSSLQ
ncbi:tektin-2-like [Centroberyx affinis]|uniref:tektin-2-like n=1 Tax=Centroberyx affinis TaxID=166261 RepID=UPI003A5BC6BF